MGFGVWDSMDDNNFRLWLNPINDNRLFVKQLNPD